MGPQASPPRARCWARCWKRDIWDSLNVSLSRSIWAVGVVHSGRLSIRTCDRIILPPSRQKARELQGYKGNDLDKPTREKYNHAGNSPSQNVQNWIRCCKSAFSTDRQREYSLSFPGERGGGLSLTRACIFKPEKSLADSNGLPFLHTGSAAAGSQLSPLSWPRILMILP